LAVKGAFGSGDLTPADAAPYRLWGTLPVPVEVAGLFADECEGLPEVLLERAGNLRRIKRGNYYAHPAIAAARAINGALLALYSSGPSAREDASGKASAAVCNLRYAFPVEKVEPLP
jgi:hypothetical protein